MFKPVTTVIKRVEGDVNKLCEDLDQFLFQRYVWSSFPRLQLFRNASINNNDLFGHPNIIILDMPSFNIVCCRYEQEFIRQPNELMQKVVYRGNFDADFKDFLRMRGFWIRSWISDALINTELWNHDKLGPLTIWVKFWYISFPRLKHRILNIFW